MSVLRTFIYPVAELPWEKRQKESLTDKATNRDYNFDGVNKVNVYSIPTVPLNDYDMNAETNRYGKPTELGNDVQSLGLNDTVILPDGRMGRYVVMIPEILKIENNCEK